MKINEAEVQVGISKKNIRFYEEQGLLSPLRNSENGYRDYGEREVAMLRQIKLLRKLGLPLEEIRQMQGGRCTVADAMRRHLVTLERERRNLEQSIQLCHDLKGREERLDSLDAIPLLQEMERMEREGISFKDRQRTDIKPIRYVAPIVVTILMTALMAGVIALMIWDFATDPAQAPPGPVMALLFAMPGAVILGMLLALGQRLHEIQKGEEDDAKNY